MATAQAPPSATTPTAAGQAAGKSMPALSRGPSVIFHGKDLTKTLDEQLHSATETLQAIKLEQRDAERAHVKNAVAHVARAHRLLSLETDPQYVEMCNFLAECESPRADAAGAGQQPPCHHPAPPALPHPFDARRTHDDWLLQRERSLKSALVELRMIRDPEMAERTLRHIYEWFVSQQPVFVSHAISASSRAHMATAPPPAPEADFWSVATAANDTLPGSAFYEGAGKAGADRDQRRLSEDDDGERRASEAADRRASQPPSLSEAALAARGLLPDAKGRLQGYARPHVISDPARRPCSAGSRATSKAEIGVRPLSALSASAKSTATGGLYTARSIATPSGRSTGWGTYSRPTSASSYHRMRVMSAGTPGLSSPGRAQADGGAARAQAPAPPPQGSTATPALPSDAVPRPQSAQTTLTVLEAPVQVAARPTPAAARAAAQAAPQTPLSQEEQNMEERWLLARNREVSEMLVGLQQRSAMRSWAERRARVEEEITRNVEASRFQSNYQTRSHVAPPDADEDVEPARPPSHALTLAGAARPTEPDPLATESRQEATTEAEAARDEARDDTEGTCVRFEGDLEQPPHQQQHQRPAARPLSARLAHLRRIHAGVLRSGMHPELDDFESQAVAAGGSVVPFFETQEGAKYTPLSVCMSAMPSATVEVSLQPGAELGFQDDGGIPPIVLRVIPGTAAHRCGVSEGCRLEKVDGADTRSMKREALQRALAKRPVLLTFVRQPRPLQRPDETDALVGVCDSWCQKHRLEESRRPGLNEMRNKQLDEVEKVKEAFERRGLTIDPAVLEQGLVMPEHAIKASCAGACLFNTTTNLLSNPFYKVPGRGKKPRRRKGAGAASRAASSYTARAPPGSVASATQRRTAPATRRPASAGAASGSVVRRPPPGKAGPQRAR